MRRSRLLRLLAVVSLSGASGVIVPPQPALAVVCKDVQIIWARGTGAPELDDQGTQFVQTDLGGRIAESGATWSEYRLGTGSGFGGFDYSAGGGSWLDFAVGGYLNLGGPYADSVAQGRHELAAYLADRAAACPNETFVLGGWSQGAQVIGEGLFDLTASVRARIAFVALFGDPKRNTGFFLPTSPDLPMAFPPACEGHPEVWIRGTANCASWGGFFGARDPYLPADIEARVGSWCRKGDGACEALGMQEFEAQHPAYFEDGSDSLVAAREAALMLKDYLPQFDFDVSWYPFAIGLGGADLGFVFDTTGSMSSHIANAKAEATDLANTWTGLFPNGRVGLVEYRDQGDAFVSRLDLGLTDDASAFQTAVNGLAASGGGDTPEAALSGVMTALNQLDWRDGATKVIVLITDAPGKDPEPITGFTTASVVQRALQIDPVAVYTVNVANLTDVTTFFTPLASNTGAQVISVQPGQTLSDAVLDVIEVVSLDPVATLNGPYVAQPGTPIQFDTYPSFDPDSELVSFQWDFDGNGTVDQTTNTPTVAHTYSSAFHGLAVVRVVSADGGSALASANVSVDSIGLRDLYPLAPSSATATVAGSNVTVAWTSVANDRAVDYYVYFEDGTLAGRLSATQPHSMTLSGVNLSVAQKFFVSAVNASGQSTRVPTQTVGGTAWGSVIRVNDDATTLHQVAPTIALGPNGAAIAAWQDYRASPSGSPTSQIDIYSARRDPTTQAWSANVRVNDVATGQQYKPSIAVGPNNDAYAVWVDSRNSRSDIYFAKRSASTGAWSANVRVNTVTSFQSQDYPAIAVSPNGDAIALWYRAANNKLNVWAARLPAGASTWGPEFRVTSNQTTQKQDPEVTFGPTGIAYAIWMDPAVNNADIWYASLPAGSSTWSTNFKVSDDPGTAFQGPADIGVDGSGNVTVVWTDRRVTPYQLRARRLPSGGSWAPSTVITADGGNSPSIAVRADGRAYVAWHDGTFSTEFPRVYSSFYTPGTNSWSSPERVDASPSDHGATSPAIALDTNRLIALWVDQISNPTGATNADIISRTRTP